MARRSPCRVRATYRDVLHALTEPEQVGTCRSRRVLGGGADEVSQRDVEFLVEQADQF